MNELKEKLLIETKKYITKQEELDCIIKGLNFAINHSKGIKCYNGSDYILHILRTALILTDLHSDYITITSCLIHSPITLDKVIDYDIKSEFGEEIATITNCLEKINKLKLKSKGEIGAINLRKVLVGLSSDFRVIIIKLASRLDNLRYIYTTPSEEQKNKCQEAEKVLIPIAHRLGINYIKSELEDLCLKYLHPDDYKDISERLDKEKNNLTLYLDEMKEELSDILIDNNIKFRIKGRVKSIHSLYQKLQKGKRWSEIYDILALRIIVEKETECYLTIGLIHSKYRPIPNRFKDYIAKPKENMYQSLHTGVIGPGGNVFEVQIRTEEMDEIAECGVASHWSYKEHGTKAIQNLMEEKLELFRDLIETSESDEEAESEFKKVFVEKMVYVFTPSGDVIELPEGSTPVDLAYKIHTHIGDTMVGAIVNDQIVPIDYQLQNDDIVKINTSENSTPNKDWLAFVKTNQARNKIKAYYNKKDKLELITRGNEILEKEIRKKHLKMSDVFKEESINKITKELKLKDLDDIKMSIGLQRYTASYVLNILNDEKVDAADYILDKMSSNKNIHLEYKNDIIVAGCDEVLINIASCCSPVKGDDIVGYITKGKGITIHKKDCPNVDINSKRLIDVSWNEETTASYITRLLIKTNEDKNNVLDIVTKSSQRNLSIIAINTINRDNSLDYEVEIKVPDTNTLKQFMVDLENLEFVIEVERMNK